MVLAAGFVQPEGMSLSREQACQLDDLYNNSQTALTCRSDNAKQVSAE